MWNIALNTFKEIVRNKFLYLIMFFAAVFIIFSLALWKLTISGEESNKVIIDFGLAMIEIFWLIGVLFVGSQLLFKEIEGKTIFLILSKPIARSDFILWKFLWFSGTIACIIWAQALLYLLVLFFQNIEIQTLILWALFFTFLKLEILLAIVFLFSTFMTHIMTIMCSLMVYLISHNFSLIIDLFVRMKEIAVIKILHWFQSFFPPLQALNVKDVIGTFSDFPSMYFVLNSFYALFYIALVLALSTYIFSRKTFEN